jgi:hypothetical protein
LVAELAGAEPAGGSGAEDDGGDAAGAQALSKAVVAK